MKKRRIESILKYLSFAIIFITLLSYYSQQVYWTGRGERPFGSFTEAAVYYFTFSSTIKQVLTNKVQGIKETYLKVSGSAGVNDLARDVIAMRSFWNESDETWDIELTNLRTDSVLHGWKQTTEDYRAHTYNQNTILHERRQFENAPVQNSILLSDKSVIFFNTETPNLFRVDSTSRIIWSNHELIFHHAMNLDHDGNLWVCASDTLLDEENKPVGRVLRNIDGKIYPFREDYIAKLDAETGKVIYQVGVMDLFIRHGLSGLVYGFSTMPSVHSTDPIHLNDIEPVMKDTDFWKKGDLFLSIRNRSLIILYRPDTDEIIRLIYGPFLNQHDVDIYSDHEISFLNNNYYSNDRTPLPDDHRFGNVSADSLFSSEVILYDFRDSSFSIYLKDTFIDEGIKTYTQGVHHFFEDGSLYFEAENEGIAYILDSSGVVLKKQFNAPLEGYVHRTNWIRIYEQLNL